MNWLFTLGLAMLAGVAIGSAAVYGLNAQGKPPGAYAVVDIAEITDPEGFKALGQERMKPPRPFLRTLVVDIMRTGRDNRGRWNCAEAIFVVIAFDSAEKAQAGQFAEKGCFNAIRAKITKSRVFIVEGMQQ